MTEPSAATPTPTPAPQGFWRRLWRELLEPVLFAVLVTQFIGTLVGVDGTSMMPTLRNGERVVVPKWEPWLHKIGVGDFSRGDILIFKPPTEFYQAQPDQYRNFIGLWNYRPFLIKRLIGLPGDKIRIEAGNVYVNGAKLDQSFTTSYWQQQGCWDTQSPLANNIQAVDTGRGLESSFFKQNQQEITVPAGEYFVMGDNRTATGSEDSRLFGPVKLRDIAGRAAAVIWPIMRQKEAKADCVGNNPSDFTLSGPSEFNMRLITRPPGFSQIPNPVK